MDNENVSASYPYGNAQQNCSHQYLLPSVDGLLRRLNLPADRRRLIELGCGNASVAAHLHTLGFQVTAIDASTEGIAQARRHYPQIETHCLSVYDDLRKRFGTFSVVISLEVIEHLYAPREFAARVFSLLEPGGTAIISTPYHGYLKNLAIALVGQTERHFNPLWDGGHIKFWSKRSLQVLFSEAGFSNIEFRTVGRIPPLAKSLIAILKG